MWGLHIAATVNPCERKLFTNKLAFPPVPKIPTPGNSEAITR